MTIGVSVSLDTFEYNLVHAHRISFMSFYIRMDRGAHLEKDSPKFICLLQITLIRDFKLGPLCNLTPSSVP